MVLFPKACTNTDGCFTLLLFDEEHRTTMRVS